jgi:hypothetical protein
VGLAVADQAEKPGKSGFDRRLLAGLVMIEAAALAFELAAAVFTGESALYGGAAGPFAAACRWRRCEGLAQKCAQAFAGVGPVATLGAKASGTDGDHRAIQSSGEVIQKALTFQVAECGRVGKVERKLHSGIGGVHALAAGSGGMRIALRQLSRRNH